MVFDSGDQAVPRWFCFGGSHWGLVQVVLFVGSDSSCTLVVLFVL